MTRARSLVLQVLLVASGVPRPLGAEPPGRQSVALVVALDAKSGREIWRRELSQVRQPTLEVAGGELIVSRAAQRHALRLSAATGKPIAQASGTRAPPAIELEQLPRNLITRSGRRIDFDEQAPPRHLMAVEGDRRSLVLALEERPRQLHVAGALAIFQPGRRARVVAWDIERARLAWERSLHEWLPQLGVRARLELAVDGDRLLVHVDQHLLALALGSGERLWLTGLPRQRLRPYDDSRASIGRHRGHLWVASGEQLVKLRSDDGRILWAYTAGAAGHPWPVLAGDRAFVAYAGERVRLSTPPPIPGRRPDESARSIARVRRGTAEPRGYELDRITRAEVPADAHVYWSLAPPEPASGGTRAGRVVLRLLDPDASYVAELDLSGVVARYGVAYVEFSDHLEALELAVGGALVRSTLASWR